MASKRLFSLDKAHDFLVPYLDVTFGLDRWDAQFEVYPTRIHCYINFLHDAADIYIEDCRTLSEFKKKAKKAIIQFEAEEQKRKQADKYWEETKRLRDMDKLEKLVKAGELFNPDAYNSPWGPLHGLNLELLGKPIKLPDAGVTMRTLHDCKESGCLKECE